MRGPGGPRPARAGRRAARRPPRARARVREHARRGARWGARRRRGRNGGPAGALAATTRAPAHERPGEAPRELRPTHPLLADRHDGVVVIRRLVHDESVWGPFLAVLGSAAEEERGVGGWGVSERTSGAPRRDGRPPPPAPAAAARDRASRASGAGGTGGTGAVGLKNAPRGTRAQTFAHRRARAPRDSLRGRRRRLGRSRLCGSGSHLPLSEV